MTAWWRVKMARCTEEQTDALWWSFWESGIRAQFIITRHSWVRFYCRDCPTSYCVSKREIRKHNYGKMICPRCKNNWRAHA